MIEREEYDYRNPSFFEKNALQALALDRWLDQHRIKNGIVSYRHKVIIYRTAHNNVQMKETTERWPDIYCDKHIFPVIKYLA